MVGDIRDIDEIKGYEGEIETYVLTEKIIFTMALFDAGFLPNYEHPFSAANDRKVMTAYDLFEYRMKCNGFLVEEDKASDENVAVNNSTTPEEIFRLAIKDARVCSEKPIYFGDDEQIERMFITAWDLFILNMKKQGYLK